MTRKLFTIFTACTLLIALRANAVSSDSIFEPSDIHYGYSIFDNYGRTDCIGSLSFSLHIPDDVTHILFERTSSHYDKNQIFFSLKRDLPFTIGQTSMEVLIKDMMAGTYFRICFMKDEGGYNFSSIYNTNSYISQTDLDIINNASGMQDIVEQNESLRYDPITKTLIFEGEGHCEVFDLTGRYLFKGNGCDMISLANVDCHLIIVRYTDNRSTLVKKIRL